MELTKERLIIIIASGIGIVLLGLYLFLYGPLINKLRITHFECKKIETELFQAQEAITSLKTAPTKKDIITEERVSLGIDELTKEGKSQDINFISITPKQIQKLEVPFKILPIEMEIESAYQNLGIFLGKLDDLEKCFIKVRKFNIVLNQLKPKLLTTKMTVNLYFDNAEQENRLRR